MGVVALGGLGCWSDPPEDPTFATGLGVGTDTDDNGIGVDEPTGDDDGGDDDDDDGADTGTKLDVGPGDPSGGAGDDSACPCVGVQDGIYVFHSPPGAFAQPEVQFFDPPANTFTPIGQVDCPTPQGYVANSMAIDRAGRAWLNFYDPAARIGKLYRAPLSDLSACEEVPYAPPADGWFLLGMGYATLAPDSSCDELFVYKSDRYLDYPDLGTQGASLAKYDEATGALGVVGPTDYPVGELTGTGDARLFTFATVSTSLAVLVDLDKDSGTEFENTELQGLDITSAFAFGFWGGDVYFFTETAPQSGTSKVTKLDHDGNEGGGLSTYNANTGLRIIGAGVSTCASFVPPG